MRIIGFGHRKRVGKDTCVKFAMSYLRQARPDLKFEKLSLGNAIKRVATGMYSWGGLEDHVYYANHEEKIEEVLAPIGKSPRQIWDELAIAGREISERTWIELALKGMDADIALCDSVRSISDVRLVTDFGGWCVRVDRAAPQGGVVDEWLKDYTGWVEIIDNNGDQRQLNQRVQAICKDALDAWYPR